MAVCFLWFQILLLTLSSAHSDVFTSVGQMTDLLLTERTLIGSLKDYIKAEEDKLEKIKKWANEVDDISEGAIQDPESFLGHPVNAFKLLRRLNSEWAKIEDLALIDLTGKFISNLTIKRDVFPNDEDQIGGAKALMRLQDTYKLDTETIATGMLPGASPNSSQDYIMTVDDCFDLGKVAFNEEDYHHAWLWLTQALKQLDEGQKPYMVDEVTILDYLSFTAYLSENYEDAVEYSKRLLELAPNHQRASGNLIHFEFELFKQLREDKLKKEKEEKKNRGEDEDEKDEEEEAKEEKDEGKKEDEEEEEEKKAKGKQKKEKKKDPFFDYQYVKKIYEALCRGEGLKMTPKRQSRLFCRYHDNNHPKYIIGPVKQEDEWDQPLIVRYYDIVTDYEIETMKELAKPRLSRAMVEEVQSGETIQVPVNYRISKSAWLGTYEHPVLYYINKRIGDLSGLDMTTAESLQVVNYGVGGHYEPHFDFKMSNEPDPFKDLGTGNRIATGLLYLSDVAAGGATVFPDIGLFLSPIKGSVVFWYNLYPSGRGDLKTRHAGCPVLVGNKWVGNKWIHERGQEFRRPCGLQEKN